MGTGSSANGGAVACQIGAAAIDMGGKIWVDLECKLMHLGQHLFRGDLAESMKMQGRW